MTGVIPIVGFVPQDAPEWRQVRIGKVTASRIADLIAKTKTGWGASRANYMAELVAERLTGFAVEGYTNAAMQWGIDTEPTARAAYEFLRDATVDRGGFVPHQTIGMSGATPDGFVGVDGLIEIKCPNTSTHIETLLGRSVPGKYLSQMQWQMACTGRGWCDFISFDPRMPAAMQFFCARVERNDNTIAELEKLVGEFLDELAGKVSALTDIYGTPEIAASSDAATPAAPLGPRLPASQGGAAAHAMEPAQ